MDTGKIEGLDALLRQSQVIIGGLAMGVLVFLVIVLFIGEGFQALDPGAVVSMVMGAFALSAVFMRLFVPGVVVNTACQKIAADTWVPGTRTMGTLPDTDEGKLMQLFLTKTIISAALLEGGAFGCLVAFMLEGQIYTLVLAVALLLGILVGFPTRTALLEWLETQVRRVKEHRSLKR